MKKFILSKGDHVVTTVSAIEAVNYRARGYRDVEPEALKPSTNKTKNKSEATEAKESK